MPDVFSGVLYSSQLSLIQRWLALLYYLYYLRLAALSKS